MDEKFSTILPEAEMTKKTIICIPGLGGHPSVFSAYDQFFSQYKLRHLELVNRQKAFKDLMAMINEETKVILLCNCYGAQIALQAVAVAQDKVRAIVIVEPFFVQFQQWLILFRPVIKFLYWVSLLTDCIGLRRRHFTYQPDYAKLAKYPIYVQPIFDMRWQDLTDYFDKIYDILTYTLPSKIENPTLLIFSPKGFMRSGGVRKKLQNIFVNSHVVETDGGTHNIVTIMEKSLAASIDQWLVKTT